MCILIYKPKNVEMPKEEYLIESWVSNPDFWLADWQFCLSDRPEPTARKQFGAVAGIGCAVSVS